MFVFVCFRFVATGFKLLCEAISSHQDHQKWLRIVDFSYFDSGYFKHHRCSMHFGCKFLHILWSIVDCGHDIADESIQHFLVLVAENLGQGQGQDHL